MSGQILPPERVEGTREGVAGGLAALCNRGETTPPATPLDESEEAAPPSAGVTLGSIRAQMAAAGGGGGDDGTPECAWDPATRLEGVETPPRRPSPAPAPAPAPSQTPPLEEAAQALPARPATVPSGGLSALVAGALKAGGR